MLAMSALAACSGTSTDVQADPSIPAPTRTAAPPTSGPVVVAISIDGLNPDAITTLGREGLPHVWRLIDQGASTLNARTAYERTTTLPNHTAMLTGRHVAGDAGTSITFNDDNGSTLARVHGSYVPSMFDLAHDAGVKTALFAEKDKFRFLVRSFDKNNGAADVTGTDEGRDKIDLAAIEPASRLVGQVAGALTRQDARLVFWHIAAPDAAGHQKGWLSPAYLRAVQSADRQVGQVLAALDSDPGLQNRTTLLLTSDHGGAEGARRHTDESALADHRIPFIVWGRDVTPGADLYDLNPERADPGRAGPVTPVRSRSEISTWPTRRWRCWGCPISHRPASRSAPCPDRKATSAVGLRAQTILLVTRA